MWGVAADTLALPLRMVSYSDHERPGGPAGRVQNLSDPFRLARAVRGVNSESTYVLREFLTLPLLLAAPAFGYLRRRTWLVCVHNLQRARQRRLDRLALRRLVVMGFRLLIPESRAGVSLLRLRNFEGNVAVVPLGVTEAQAAAPRGPKESGLVSLVGRARREKDFPDGIRRIGEALSGLGGAARFVVGTDDRELLGRAAALGVETVDTTAEADFRALLARSQAVVLTYAREDYELRTSGVVLDAAAAYAAVVCPDYAVLADQVRTPTEIGAVYAGEHELGAAIARALELAQDASRFEAYLAARSGPALAERLRALLAPASGGKPA